MAMRTCIYPNLAAEMARRHHTQHDLASMLGMSQSALSMRLAGVRDLHKTEIDFICNQYEREFEYLFATEGKEHVTNGKRSIGDSKD